MFFRNHLIRRVDAITGEVTSFCGQRHAYWKDGACAQAAFNCPFGITSDVSGNLVIITFGQPLMIFQLVSEWNGNRVRLVNMTDMFVSTIAGDPSNGSGSQDGIGAQVITHFQHFLILHSQGTLGWTPWTECGLKNWSHFCR